MRRSAWRLTLLMLVIDLALTEGALYLAEVLRTQIGLGWEISEGEGLLTAPVYVIVAAVWSILFVALGVYSAPARRTAAGEVRRTILGGSIATLVFAGLLYMTYRMVSRLLFIYFCLIDLAALVAFRLLLRSALALWGFEDRRVVIVGDGELAHDVARSLQQHRGIGLTIAGYVADTSAAASAAVNGLHWLGPIDRLQSIIAERQIDEVVLAFSRPQHERAAAIVSDLQPLPLRIWMVPDYMGLATARAAVEEIGGIPLIGLREPAIYGTSRLVKRVFDLAVGVPVLVLTSPLMLLIALLIRLDSPGPVLFLQERVGENGRRFRMWKFRTMVANAEALLPEVMLRFPDGSFQHKRRGDPRVTRIGRLLRRSSLDELPQLVNVLTGEMSLVGPRPELPFVVDQYSSLQRSRLAVPPGMTGWWQINGRSDEPLHWNIQYDLYYVQNYSVFLDLWIMVRTIGTILRGKGAY